MRILLLVVVAACGGGDNKPTVDAAPTCAKTAYDPCRDEHDCNNIMCAVFSTALTVCSESCTGTECPMQDGVPVPCDPTLHKCKPAHPTACVH